MITWRTRIEIAAAIIAAGLVWYYATPAPAPVHEWTPAAPATQIAAVPKEEIKPAKVEVYAPAAKKKLDLPPAVQADPNQYVLSAAKVKADRHPETITTLFDAETGKSETLIRREPYPWLAAEQSGELRLDYGIKNGGLKIARLSLHENLVQIKALHLGVNASLDTDGMFFAGAGVGWGW